MNLPKMTDNETLVKGLTEEEKIHKLKCIYKSNEFAIALLENLKENEKYSESALSAIRHTKKANYMIDCLIVELQTIYNE